MCVCVCVCVHAYVRACVKDTQRVHIRERGKKGGVPYSRKVWQEDTY